MFLREISRSITRVQWSMWRVCETIYVVSPHVSRFHRRRDAPRKRAECSLTREGAWNRIPDKSLRCNLAEWRNKTRRAPVDRWKRRVMWPRPLRWNHNIIRRSLSPRRSSSAQPREDEAERGVSGWSGRNRIAESESSFGNRRTGSATDAVIEIYIYI